MAAELAVSPWVVFVIAMVAMAASDWLDACSTIAEARGASRSAGRLTAGDNTLAILVAVLGADTLHTSGVLALVAYCACVWLVTDFTTARATSWAAQRKEPPSRS